MAERTRVSALAKELGLSSKEVLAKLNGMGEYVKSASSRVEAPVAERLRAAVPDRPAPKKAPPPPAPGTPAAPPPAARLRNPFDPLYVPPMPPARGPYRGDEPSGLKKLILDEYIVRRSTGRRPHGNARYWASEVAEADSLTAKWAPALLDGMTPQQVLRWIQVLSAYSAEQAAALFAEGVEPDEIEFDRRFDLGRPSLQTRLSIGNVTVREATTEVRKRRRAR